MTSMPVWPETPRPHLALGVSLTRLPLTPTSILELVHDQTIDDETIHDQTIHDQTIHDQNGSP